MNRELLTVLGCSGSLVVLLATGSVVRADTLSPTNSTPSDVGTPANREIIFAAPQSESPAESQLNSPSGSVKSDYTSADLSSDTVGDLAIQKFHCDCNACRVAVVQMMQTGQL